MFSLHYKQVNHCKCMQTHTHGVLTQRNEVPSGPAKCPPCSSIIVWQSATTLTCLFSVIYSQDLSASVEVRCLPVERKSAIWMWKSCGNTRVRTRVPITVVISWAVIKQNRLNWCGLLLKWDINPSTSLKCTVRDSGKLLSAGLFACLLPPRRQIYLVGKHLSKGLVSHLLWLLTQLRFTKSQTMSGDKLGKRFEGCNKMIWNCFPYGAVNVKNKACGFWKFLEDEAVIAVELQTHKSWHISFLFWHLTAFDLGTGTYFHILFVHRRVEINWEN